MPSALVAVRKWTKCSATMRRSRRSPNLVNRSFCLWSRTGLVSALRGIVCVGPDIHVVGLRLALPERPVNGTRLFAYAADPTFLVVLNHLNVREASPKEKFTMLIDTQVRV